MPELPEIKNVVKQLNNRIQNKIIKNIEIKSASILKEISISEFKKQTEKQKIKEISNYGKWIIFHLTNKNILVHLRMEGKFRTDFKEHNPKHDHIIFTFEDNIKLYFNDTRKFGVFLLRNANYKNELPLLKLANEPQNTNTEWLFNKLQKKRINIKTALLDQTLLLGLGNIYINEVLWEAQIHPKIPSYQINKIELNKILKISHEIMEKSFQMGGSTIKRFLSFGNIEGKFQKWLKVYGKQNTPCKRCQTTIQKIQINGRGTYFCSKCQVIKSLLF